MAGKTMAGKRRVRLSSVLVVTVMLVVVGLLVVNTSGTARPSLSRRNSAGAHPSSGPVTRAAPPARDTGSARVSAYLADLPRAESATSGRLAAQTPGMPACNPPPIPAATYPPGAAYGVPFLAAITNGQVLAGYDEWTANHLVWKADKMKFDLYPWQSKIYDITGWVTGLLQLPSLTAQIAPQDVVFCDQGGASCLNADWPAGECVQIQAQYGPSPASKTPPPALGSSHPEGTSCSDYSTPTFECFPYVVSLTPSGTTTLTVSGRPARRRPRCHGGHRGGDDGGRSPSAAVDIHVHLSGPPGIGHPVDQGRRPAGHGTPCADAPGNRYQTAANGAPADHRAPDRLDQHRGQQ